LSANLPNTPETRVLRSQLSKAGTSVGANYREANRSRRAKDFKNKIKISESESSETDYWLEIIEALDWGDKSEVTKTRKEAKELLAIFTSVTKKL
jgi:four helix bundle protein